MRPLERELGPEPRHYWYMNLARAEAAKSPDLSNKVGCVIRRAHGYDVLGVGYNSYPKNHHPNEPVDYSKGSQHKYDRIIHAEMRALINAQDSVHGGTMYTTLPPCSECAKHIADAGIMKLIIPTEAFDSDYVKRFESDQRLARQILEESRVTIILLPHPEPTQRLAFVPEQCPCERLGIQNSPNGKTRCPACPKAKCSCAMGCKAPGCDKL